MQSANRAVKTRFTLLPLGWAFIFMTFAGIIAAWNTGENLLYIVVGGLLSLIVLSVVTSIRTLANIHLFRDTAKAVNRNEPFFVTVRIENRKWFMPAFSLCIDSTADGTAQSRFFRSMRHGERTAFVVVIPPRRAAELRMSEILYRRGVYPLPPLRISSAFPFGLIETSCYLRDNVEIVVYPHVKSVDASRIRNLKGIGRMTRVEHGDGDEFFSLREYVPGDDLRRIAWKASARRGNLLVKEQQVDCSRFITIVVDTYNRPDVLDFEERFEEAVELAASLAISLLDRLYKVALLTPTECIPMDEGNQHATRILDLLARVQPIPNPGVLAFPAAGRLGERFSAYVYVSPDPREWGSASGFRGAPVLNPREMSHAH